MYSTLGQIETMGIDLMTRQNRNGKRLIVKDVPNKGKGVFTNADIHKGEVVIIGKPVEILTYRTMTSLQVSWDRHAELDSPACVTNHSCDPNLAVKNNSYGGYTFYAFQDIACGSELNWDYNTTEYVSISVSTCYCGAKNCRGKTLGFKFLEDELRSLYGDHIADYLKPPYKGRLHSVVSRSWPEMKSYDLSKQKTISADAP